MRQHIAIEGLGFHFILQYLPFLETISREYGLRLLIYQAQLGAKGVEFVKLRPSYFQRSWIVNAEEEPEQFSLDKLPTRYGNTKSAIEVIWAICLAVVKFCQRGPWAAWAIMLDT